MDLLPAITAAWFPAVANMALVMIGFLLGGQLTGANLREHGRQVIGVSLAVVVTTFVVVFGGLLAVGVPPPLSTLR